MFLWQTWNDRNIWVFERKKLDPRITCARTFRMLGEFEAATTREEEAVISLPVNVNVWKPPTPGRWKLNTDAAMGESKVGMGMVVRDNSGDVLMCAGQ